MSATIKDVAKQAGVALSTVSRVVNHSGYVKADTRMRVMRAIESLDYTPNAMARNLHTRHSSQIGVIVSELTNPYFSHILQAICDVLVGTGFGIIIANSNGDVDQEKEAIQMMAENRVCGLIIAPQTGANRHNGEFLQQLQEKGTPIVTLDNEIADLTCEGVYYDNYTGAFDAVKVLFNNGHRRIAIMHGPVDYKTERERLQGYLAAHQELNLTPDPYLQYETDIGIDSAVQTARRIVRERDERPTAIFCCSNSITIGCIKAIQEANLRIPDDIALIGSDEIDPYRIWANHITIISQPTDELGKIAAHTLLTRIRNADPDNQTPVNRIVLQPRLMIRGSEKLPAQSHT